MEEREVCAAIPNAALAELGNFLRQCGGTLSPTDAAIPRCRVAPATPEGSGSARTGAVWPAQLLRKRWIAASTMPSTLPLSANCSRR
jgi:hypothetical protein